MNNPEALEQMLSRYTLDSLQDHKNAVKEIVQEIALLGLWRAKFFEHAAFYGGTAMRILYGLDRFSEDLEFTLLKPNRNFDITKYEKAIQRELESLGFNSKVQKKKKTLNSAVESAFIKINTIEHLILIGIPDTLNKNIQKEEMLKIRLEVDTDPPKGASEENKLLLLPFPFTVKTLQKQDLFAGKIHAVLCRDWKGRVKGRDWYDLVWFISRNTPINLDHLTKRMRQTKHWKNSKKISMNDLIKLLNEKIESLDITSAKKDIINFIADPMQIELWSKEFFKELVLKIYPHQNT